MKHLTIVLCLLGMLANAQTKTGAKTTAAKGKNTKAETPATADRKAEFVGGNVAMEKYIVANLKYQPKLDTDTNIKTRNVFMKFMIDKTGKVTDVSVMKGIKGCKECNEEATRVVSSMPNWNYAIENSQPVDAWFTLPITFSKH
jgi:hypothetical protein